jgi:type II restriction/modification system DNA methylase subunit YeeA
MNNAKLKSYAPQARKDFMQAISDRAAFYGITADKTEPIKIRGDVVVILGREHSKAVASKRMLLEERIKQLGFAQTIEAIAYSWFNRLVALRYMELHGYLDHGYRVLSHPKGKDFPETLEHVEHLDLPNLDKNIVINLKLAGNKENELYRLILLAQCNGLHQAMPFLFERIDDETELLLPENLLNSDSLIRKLVNGIEESDWDKVEIIGWLYQYYISDKKDEVIGSVVASEDIPAATQLFTPNWIVKYLVQNTLGRQWLATYPDSALRTQMEYYIEPAEQEPEVAKKLKEITPESLNPEEITFLDPACGSGHILVEAYDLFKAIYQERGYRSKDIPALILQKNLFGFEIDDRAGQLAMFALTMKAREDDRNLFQTQKGESGIQPNILCFVESKDLNPESITAELNANISVIGKDNIPESDISELIALFEHAKTFGSLIQIPEELVSKLPGIEKRLKKVESSGDLSWMGLKRLVPLIQQAKMLAQKYDAVVANPPYMGNKYLSPMLKVFLKKHYLGFEKDLFSASIKSFCLFANPKGKLGFITPFVWMFISSFEQLRQKLIDTATIETLIQLEYNAFEPACIPVCCFVVSNTHILNFRGSYIKLSEFRGHENQPIKTLEAIRNKSCGWFYEAKPNDFKKIPGSPIAYWIGQKIINLFSNEQKLGEIATSSNGVQTGNNGIYVRAWFEINNIKMNKKWIPYNKGGTYRKWYGNFEFVVNWNENGKEIKSQQNSCTRGEEYYFTEGVTWSDVTSGTLSCRYLPPGFIFDASGPSAFFSSKTDLLTTLALLNTHFSEEVSKILNPTMHFQSGDFRKIPVGQKFRNSGVGNLGLKAIKISKSDWDSFETSWDFKTLPILLSQSQTLAKSQETADTECLARFAEMKQLEEENNRLFIDAYGLQGELTPDVPDDQITLHRPNREQDIKRLISYAIGCMMGRYSLDKEGIIYANSGNEDFDPTQYKTYPADEDGIIPVLNHDWGIADDATARTVEFIKVLWPKEYLEENLFFISQSLGATPKEPSRDVIRNYFSTSFYKDHLQKYKKRPIYWLFSSGKLRAFQCLVYLHRYNEGTLSRIRTEYVIPIQSRIVGRIEQLEGDKLKATSTSHRNKLQKEQNDLKKQQEELKSFEEKLKHAAERKIKLDLDDGVKVNYAKFTDKKYGEILAEVKVVTRGSEE